MRVGDLVRLSDGSTLALVTNINKSGTCRVMTSRGFFLALVPAQVKEVVNASR